MPIWFSFKSKALQAFFSIARAMREGFVTRRSSPTIWRVLPFLEVSSDQPCQSSWSKPSSIDTTGYFYTIYS